MMQPSQSTRLESSEEETLKEIALLMENCGDFPWTAYIDDAKAVMSLLRSKGLINNG